MDRLRKYLDILRRQKKPYRFIVSRILRYSGLWRFFTVQRDGYILRLHPALLALSFWVDATERGADSLVLKHLLSPGDIYIDVGANVGHLAIEASIGVGKNGKVYAYEAHPRTFRFLMENLSLNRIRNVYPMLAAVGEKYGWVKFSSIKSDDQNKVIDKTTNVDYITVPVVPLYPFINGLHIKLLKIDVEGFELFVIKGLREALDEIECIYFEVMDTHYAEYGYSFKDIYKELAHHGFLIGRPLQEGGFRLVEKEEKFDDCLNLLACKDVQMLGHVWGD